LQGPRLRTNETLYAYTCFLAEPTEYVLNQLIDTVLAKDKDFVQWRASHPVSYVPANSSREAEVRAGRAVPRRFSAALR
jgi:hypothetical protein